MHTKKPYNKPCWLPCKCVWRADLAFHIHNLIQQQHSSDNVYGAVIMTCHYESSLVNCRVIIKRQMKPADWGCELACSLIAPFPFLIITEPKAWHSSYCAMKAPVRLYSSVPRLYTSVHVILTLISAVCLKIRKDQQGMPTLWYSITSYMVYISVKSNYKNVKISLWH